MLMPLRFSNMSKCYGFGIIKNGVKFDFPFKESIQSVAPLTQSFFYGLGDSEDNTNQIVKSIPQTVTFDSVWDTSTKDGIVISIETNKALDLLRSKVDVKNAWGIYLQADEVIHEDDLELLRNDIEYAEKNGFDAISFRYLHFWMSHTKLAITKTWYPHEIRAIKLDSPIVSWGDGQSFQNFKKIFYTEARIFHYGHIRDPKAYQEKMRFQASFHYKGLRYYRKRFESFRNALKQKSIKYLGTHPKVMAERIQRIEGNISVPVKDTLYILGDESLVNLKLIKSVNVNKIIWVKSIFSVPITKWFEVVILKPSFLHRLFALTKVPNKMHSPLAKEWSMDFLFILKVSEKNIGFRNI